ncbi:MAG: phosphopantetheine-binding protein [Thermodesulfobacteriota bacterium]
MILADINELEQKLLNSIINICEFTEPVPDEMTINSPLIGPDSPLGLDSLDAVEIMTMIQSDFKVRITSKETSVEVLNSIKSLADYIRPLMGGS